MPISISPGLPLVRRLTLAWALALSLGGTLTAADPAADPLASASLADLADGRLKLIDLSYPLNDQSNFWPGPGYHPFKIETIATLEQNGVLSKAVSYPEHIGTHVDAPNHFEADQPDVAGIAPGDLVGRGVVLDISARAEHDPDTVLTVADIAAWEAAHGRIPAHAIVLLHTGWARYWDRPLLYQGRDTLGKLHFPSFSPEAARMLIHDRQARAIGVDTLSIDPGTSQKFEVHHLVNAARRYGIENVAHLDQLPPHGFLVTVSPLKVEGGTGGPARVIAILRDDGAKP